MSAPLCWLNGGLLPVQQAQIDPSDRGFTLGDGVFETISVRRGAMMHMGRHLARMERGSSLLGLRCPWPDEAIGRGAADIVRASGQGFGSVRLTLTRGPAARGLAPGADPAPTLLIAWSEPSARPAAVTAMISRVTRRNDLSPLSRIKSLNYLDSVLAMAEAARNGMQDCVLLNTVGRVACAAGANVIALRGARLVTPPVGDGALPGIARGILIERSGVIEATLSPGELHTAEAVVLTSSLWVRQVSQLDDTTYAPAPELVARLRQTIETA
jgi:branched-chain amino acid aminotransferase